MKSAMDKFLDAWIDDQEDKRKMARLGRRRLHPDWGQEEISTASMPPGTEPTSTGQTSSSDETEQPQHEPGCQLGALKRELSRG